MTTLYPAPETATTANGYPTYDDLMAAVRHIRDVMGIGDTPLICHGDDCNKCVGTLVEFREIWDTVHRILDSDFEERWVELGDNV